MNGATMGAMPSCHAALTELAAHFGVVPNGIELKGGHELIVFDEKGTQQVELEPLIKTDGTVEDASSIIGFSPAAAMADLEREDGLVLAEDNGQYDFPRDWKLVSSMMDTRVGSLMQAAERSRASLRNGLPEGIKPEDDSIWDEISFEIVGDRDTRAARYSDMTLRGLVGMLQERTMERREIIKVGADLFRNARTETDPLVAANLFFAAGVLLGETKVAMASLGSAAVRLPENYASARAIVLEMSARAMERPQIWKDVAWHWYRSLTFGSDDGTRMLRILRGMWSAWRGGDPMEMVKLMQVYTVMMHGKKNYREAAAGCVRAAMFYSEAILMTDDKDSRRDMHHAMNSLLDVGSDLFRRAGDIGPRFAIKDILDMSKKHHL